MTSSSTGRKAAPEARVGRRLRALRTSRGLSLRTVASMVGITPGALSQIERGENTPSLCTLRKILEAVGSSLGEFFSAMERSGEGDGVVYRPDQLVTVSSERGVKFLGLPGPGFGRAMQILYETYAPKHGDRADAPFSHAGEEGGFCISGTLELTVGNRCEILGPGDAYYY